MRAMRLDAADLVLCHDFTRVIPVSEAEIGDEVDDRGYVYRPVSCVVPLLSKPLSPDAGYMLYDTRQRRVVARFHATRVYRQALEERLHVEGQMVVSVPSP